VTENPGTLSSQIRQEIASRGPLRFDRFQEMALYSACGGYYERPGRVGRLGDFVTGASWHPSFARCLLRFLDRLTDLMPTAASVIDVGAGEGELLSALAAACSSSPPALVGVERSATRRSAAQSAVPSARLHPSLDDLGAPLSGLVVAYELFDALPVRALRLAEDGSLRERTVGCDDDGSFCWGERPAPDSEEVLDRLYRRGARLEPGQLLEIRPGSAGLAAQIARAVRAGVILVFDYGAGTRALYGPARGQGTLEAFLRHQVTRDVLAEPGSRDITAWVDFDEIAETFRAAGFDVAGPVSQSRFLLANGIAAELEAVGRSELPAAERIVERNAISKLFMPGGMGESIRLLIASKRAVPAATLAAFPKV
jgi:SAM-dependent MidA family methyltransferase